MVLVQENFKKSIDKRSRSEIKPMLHSQNYEEKSTKQGKRKLVDTPPAFQQKRNAYPKIYP
jgi:hypothetical protein